jgi:hypothetical protein
MYIDGLESGCKYIHKYIHTWIFNRDILLVYFTCLQLNTRAYALTEAVLPEGIRALGPYFLRGAKRIRRASLDAQRTGTWYLVGTCAVFQFAIYARAVQTPDIRV